MSLYSSLTQVLAPFAAKINGLLTGYDGTKYATPGEAVRTQISNLHVLIGDEPGVGVSGSAVGYDGTESGLSATNMQGAVDELSGSLSNTNGRLQQQGADIESIDSEIYGTTPVSISTTSKKTWEDNEGTAQLVEGATSWFASNEIPVSEGEKYVMYTNIRTGYSTIKPYYITDDNLTIIETGDDISGQGVVYLPVTIPTGGTKLLINKYGTQMALSRKYFKAPVVDYTLSVSGDAADAKTTGDRVRAVENSFANAETVLDVVLESEAEVSTGLMIHPTTGLVSNTSNFRYIAASTRLYVENYKKVWIECDTALVSKLFISFFSSTNSASLIGSVLTVDPAESPYEIELPTGAKYIFAGCYSSANAATASGAEEAAASFHIYGTESWFIGKMDTELTSEELPAQGKAVGNKLAVIEGKLNSNVKLNVPLRYELVVGDTFQLFHNGIILADKSSLFEVLITCAKGTPYSRFFEWTPKASEVGTYSITFKLYDTNHILVDEKTSSLIVKAKASSPVNETIILYVGDSLTSGGYAPGEFKRRLVAADGTPTGDGLTNISFIGSKSNGYVNYEGQGGRSWRSYIYEGTSSDTVWITAQGHGKTVADQHSIYKDANNKEWKIETIETDRIMIIRESESGTLPSTGTLTWVSGGVDTGNIVYTASENAPGNPFWNSSLGRVDLASYVTAQGANHLDYVYVLLGWNYFGTNEEVTKGYVRTFIDNVLASYPNCKVVLLGLEFPSKDGLAVNYGAKGVNLFSNYFGCVEQVCKLNTWYEEITQETAYLGKAFFVQTSGQFDTEYNMPTTTKAVNTRSAITESVQNNGVHPSIDGYYQIADAAYRDFVHRLSE